MLLLKSKSDMTDYQISKMTPDDLDNSYNLYSMNHLIMPEGFDEPIMPAEMTFGYHDFIEILQDDKTAAIVCNNVESVEESYKGYHNVAHINIFRGFLVYEYTVLNKESVYSIVFCEAEGNGGPIYQVLLDALKTRLELSNKCNKIVFEIMENRVDLIKAAFANKFVKKEMVRARKGFDSFIFEFHKKGG